MTIADPALVTDGTLPENAPVGSIVPMTAFYADEFKSKKGEEACTMRDGFAAREVGRPEQIMARRLLGIETPRSLDMEAALDAAKVDRDSIIVEVLKGELNLKPVESPDFDNQASGKLEDMDTLDGYWVATWPIQLRKEGVSTDELRFLRVL